MSLERTNKFDLAHCQPVDRFGKESRQGSRSHFCLSPTDIRDNCNERLLAKQFTQCRRLKKWVNLLGSTPIPEPSYQSYYVNDILFCHRWVILIIFETISDVVVMSFVFRLHKTLLLYTFWNSRLLTEITESEVLFTSSLFIIALHLYNKLSSTSYFSYYNSMFLDNFNSIFIIRILPNNLLITQNFILTTASWQKLSKN